MADIDAMLRELEGPTYGQAKDVQNAISVLEGLEAIGDLRPNEAEELARLRAAQPAAEKEIGATGATYRGALQGATFQQADEIYGLIGGDKEAARSKNLEAELNFPDEYKTGKAAGALGSSAVLGAATAPYATGATLWGTMGRGMGLGALEGVLWGAGGGEGLKDKAVQAGKYGLGMGILGGAAPALVAGGARAYGFADDLVRGAMNKGNAPRAYRSIAQALQRSGQSIDDVSSAVGRAAAIGQPDLRPMDVMGKAGRRVANGVMRSGGDGAEEIAQFLEKRHMNQGDRLSGFIDDAFDSRGTTAAKTTDMLKKNRKTVADTLFAKAAEDAAPVDVRSAVEILDETIDQMTNSGIRPPAVVREYQKLRRQLAGVDPDGNPTSLSDYESVLGIWREVRDNVSKAYKAGDGAIGEALKPVRDALQQALEESSDLYRFATDNYRVGSGVIDAVETGKDIATKAGRPEDSLEALRGLTDQQRRAARIGYADKLQSEIATNRAAAPNHLRTLNSDKRTAEAMELATDPALLSERLANEKAMFETQAKVMQGSQTANNLADMQNTGAIADAVRAASDAATGNAPGLLSNIAHNVQRIAGGQNEATRKIIAQILMAPNPQEALAPVAAQTASRDLKRRIVEALLRGAGRPMVGDPILGNQ